ncbi:cytochrome c maturation protein CcmE [Psychrobium sp. 1_MG-2023]|uniref:cytochrome c maturation protein CcmE n=1 Tax=Psychrobium sp. 1_MG-2023 TaxID=3062624 RepID=UPI000C33C49E|nr:cytochrome c maturation protein CcmE [Psychrobium sp. 1_MG-2023]MDP2562631.1 cytochrome c maturation protein CcmE [Psychrobium sp. 1_MG-2023]PKF54387.1 cytochrome c maturation protein CcmE [Alteromonadales bacterium alter-6D02]
MNPRRKKRLAIITTIFVGVASVIGLVLYALSQNIDLFFTPHEIVSGKDDTGIKPQIGQRIRVGGMVKEGSVQRNSENLKISFMIYDNADEVTVTYEGLLPDLFREGQGIVANGVLVAPRVVKATEVLAKHDENYISPEIAEAMGKQHKKPEYTEEQLENKSY